MSVFLTAKHVNWCEKGIYDWDMTSFELTYDGELNIVVKLYHTTDFAVERSFLLSEDHLKKIKALIPNKSISNNCDAADDGDAWEFTVFDCDGKVIFQRELDYIYDIEPLEEIGRILESYVPNLDSRRIETKRCVRDGIKRKLRRIGILK